VNALDKAAAQVRIWRENPAVFFFDEIKMDPEPWLEDFARVLPSQDPKELQIALKACTGAGKSAAFGGAVNWFVGCHGGRDATEHPIGIVTSIDQANLKSGIWKEIAVWRSRSEYMTRAFDMTSTRLFAKHAPDTWYVEARTWAKRADPEAQGRAMSGIHGKYIMAVLDEAGDIPVPLLRVAKQILSSEHQWAKLLIGGNPTSLEGVLYQACVIESHLTYSISITADPERPDRGKRTDIENAREAIKLYGRENPWVKATILGEFPPASINALLGIEDVENAMRRHYRIDAYEWAEKRLGVDCARFGDDRSMLCPRQGVVWFNPEALRNVRTSVIAGRIVQAVQKWEPHDPTSIRILIDQTGGWGQGTVDQLIVAGYPAMELVYSTPSPDPRFFNLRSYMHFKLAEHVRERAQIPDTPKTRDLRRELTAATYTLREGKLWVEPKEMIKAKLGHSPDMADGYAQTYALPDMPRRSMQQRKVTQKARTDFDPNRMETERDFDPMREI
jgi:hypothetical protein